MINNTYYQLGCGSSIPSLYLLSCNESNKVDIQDYNEQVIRYVSIPNILLNSVLNVQEPAVTNEEEPQLDTSSESEEEEEEEEEGEEDEKRIEEDPVTCDAEAEIATEQIPTMLQQVNARTRAFFGDWSTLPVSCKIKKK